MVQLKQVKCARCGASQWGYIRDDGAIMVLHLNGQFYNSWCWGCPNCEEPKHA